MYITMRALKKSLYRLSGIICTVCQQNSPKPWMYRLFVVILSEFIWPLNFIAHEFHEFSCKRVQNRIYSGYAERSRKCQEIYTNFLVLFINGDLVGRTNHTNFRASERNQVLLELPSAAENVK